MQSLHDLMRLMWTDYSGMNPQVKRIHALLQGRGENVVNDHIALRTFDDKRVGLDVLARAFTAHGYKPCGEYVFTEKKLFARHFEHADANMPKVFISELKLAECSANVQQRVGRLLDQIDPQALSRWDLPVSGRLWNVSHADYESLAGESEYAGWTAAFGFRANHFTVLVNELKTFASLEALNAFLKEQGFKLNSSGGEIKGSPDQLLEQSSTLADQVEVAFSDGSHRIPCCYYEFARRYPAADGR